MSQDPRPKNIQELVERYRKVKPVTFDPPTQKEKSEFRARKKEVTSGLEPYSGSWGDSQVMHLLRRTIFGVKRSDLNTFKSLTRQQAVDTLLVTSALPAAPLNDYHYPPDDIVDPTVNPGESWVEAAHAGDLEGHRILSLKGWLINQALTQNANVHQKMMFFWHSLLPTQSWGIFFAKTSYQYFKTLHTNALGNYKTLIKAFTLDPAALIYLNGTFNNKEAPDENYSRELQELFCIGKGPDSKYTEGDVQAAARVLTGWVIDWEKYATAGPVSSFFLPDWHDTSDKQFSSFYNNKVITGKSGAGGSGELDELLDMIVGHEETSRYICRRLYTFFVYPEIDEAAEQNVILPLADIFKANNFDIIPTLKVLLNSEHFFDAEHHGAVIKSPYDHVIGLWRVMNVTNPHAGDVYKTYVFRTQLLWTMATMGLEIADPPNVAGWAAYYQVPQFDRAWVTTDTVTKRALTNDSLIYWGLWGDTNNKANLINFVKTLSDPSDPNKLIDESITLLLGIGIQPEVRASLKSILLTGQQTDEYWTGAWNIFIGDESNAVNRATVELRLQQTFQRLMQLGEFLLM